MMAVVLQVCEWADVSRGIGYARTFVVLFGGILGRVVSGLNASV